LFLDGWIVRHCKLPCQRKHDNTMWHDVPRISGRMRWGRHGCNHYAMRADISLNIGDAVLLSGDRIVAKGTGSPQQTYCVSFLILY